MEFSYEYYKKPVRKLYPLLVFYLKVYFFLIICIVNKTYFNTMIVNISGKYTIISIFFNFKFTIYSKFILYCSCCIIRLNNTCYNIIVTTAFSNITINFNFSSFSTINIINCINIV